MNEVLVPVTPDLRFDQSRHGVDESAMLIARAHPLDQMLADAF